MKSKKKKADSSIIRAAHQALAWARGEASGARVVYVPGAVDVKAIRERLGLSQGEFADRYGFSRRTLQQWEQGRSDPDAAVRAYLMVIDRNPAAVARALRRTA